MKWQNWQCPAVAAVLCVATACAYSNSLGGPFIFDDVQAVANNPHIRKPWPIWRAARAPDGTTLSRRPVTTYTFALNHAVSGANVTGYHVTNLLIHIVAGLALFGVVRRTLA